MDTMVQPSILPSAPDRARALQPLLDAHGPEMDRRHEATLEVVEALVENDMLRLLLPRSLGGQEIHLVDFCKTTEAVGWADASMGWFVNQSNVCVASSSVAMPQDAAAAIFDSRRTGLAWGAKHNLSKAVRVDGGYRLSGTWSYLSGGRHTKWIGAHSAVQKEIGQMEAKLSSARAFVHEAASQAYDASAAGNLTLDHRMRLRLATTNAMNEATDVSVACYRGAGTTAILESAPFERRLRDALSVSQHLQAMPAHYEMVGRHIIGTEQTPQFL